MKSQEESWLLKEKYHGEKSPAFFADCERLETGEPIAYVIGSIPFLDCVIHLDSKPLIPRPETEFWVEKAILEINTHVPQGFPRQSLGKPWGRPVTVLDLCAGSGAIGIAVAKAIPTAHVTFSELDDAHFPTIEINLTRNLPVDWKVSGGQYELIASDLFEKIPKVKKFDFILTNPPYIDAEAHTVDMNVVAYEPHLALFGGRHGLELIEQIIAAAPTYLTASGQLWIEHEPFQNEAIVAIATSHGFTAIVRPDQYGTLRYSVLIKAVAK